MTVTTSMLLIGTSGNSGTARRIADQLGQAKVSITQDIYMGRQSANPAAAQALRQAFEDRDLL